jgi:hypothetical protein
MSISLEKPVNSGRLQARDPNAGQPRRVTEPPGQDVAGDSRIAGRGELA